MLQMSPAVTNVLSAIYPYVQLFTVASILFGIAWWLRDSRAQLFTKLDKMTDNHLHTIQDGITKLGESIPQFMTELHDHQTKTEVLLADIREEQRRHEQ